MSGLSFDEQPRFRKRLDDGKSRGVVTDFCSTNDYMVVTLDDGRIHIFKVQGDEHMVIDTQSKALWCAAVWEKSLFTGDRDGVIKVWDLESGQLLKKLIGHTATVRQIKILDANTAVSASRDGTLRIWDISDDNGGCKFVLEGHTGTVRAFDVFGDRIVSGGNDTTVRVWSLAQGRCLQVLRGHTDIVYTVAFDGKRIASGSADKNVRMWDPETGACTNVLGIGALVTKLVFHAGYLFTAAADGTICVWDLNEPTRMCGLEYKIFGHENSVTSLHIRNGRIYSGGSDGVVNVWDVQNARFVGQVGPSGNALWRVLSRADKVIVLVSRDRECLFEIWDSPQ